VKGPDFGIDPDAVKGFMHPDEGRRLYELARRASALGPCLEIGSYCGKSSLYLGSGCRDGGGLLFTVDHHRGSEEHQPGEAYHDPDLFDSLTGRMDSLPALRHTLHAANLEDVVVPVVARSFSLAKVWTMPLGLVFIDGGHSHAAALADYRGWAPHVVVGGYLVIHDLFDDPAEGGQAPIEIYRLAIASGLFEAAPRTRTLGVLMRQ